VREAGVRGRSALLSGGALLALAALALAGPAGCGPAKAPRNLLIVSFDTLRANRLGVYGNHDWDVSPSPRADLLASHGVTFGSVMATRGQTHPSLASMITGKYPITTGLRENALTLPPQHLTLFQLLQRAGFHTGIFLANFDAGDARDEWIFRGADVAGDGFQGRFSVESHAQSRYQEAWDERVERAAGAFLDGLGRAGGESRPFALWVHFYDLHRPYNPPAAWVGRYGVSDGLPEVLRAPGPDSGGELDAFLDEITLGERPVPAAELQRIRGLYDGTLSATDARLGRLLDKLAATGRLDDTVIVFTADHGEELFDHNRYFFHGNSVHQGVLRLPLVIAGPGLPAGARVDAPVQNIDIAPTVLDLLGLPPAPDMEGRSLAALLRGESRQPPRPFSFAEWQDLIYVVGDGQRTYVHNPRHAHPFKEPFTRAASTHDYRVDCFEGYDLRSDPLEQRNLLADLDPAQLARPDGLPPDFAPLRRALEEWLAEPDHEREMSWPGLSPDRTQEWLNQLGYVSGGKGRPDVRLQPPCGP
jgi:arylsulfatase A-like enzyme